MRLLIDTNVFLDVLLDRGELSTISRNFFQTANNHNDEIYISSCSLKDIAYFLKKKTHNDEETNRVLINIYCSVTKIVGISPDDAINALYLKGDYEDNCLCETYHSAMCDAIITNNIKHFRKNNINVLTPKNYLMLFKKI